MSFKSLRTVKSDCLFFIGIKVHLGFRRTARRGGRGERNWGGRMGGAGRNLSAAAALDLEFNCNQAAATTQGPLEPN